MPTSTPQDPISAASAGLLALGVPAQRRMETLGLLSALLDLADGRGEVLLDSDLMATEDRLGIDACLEGYEWLERLDVIQRTWSGWMIKDFDEHHGPAGLTAASMAILQRHLSGAEAPEPVGLVPVREMAPVVALSPWRRRLPVVAASVAAGIAVLTGATQLVPQAAVTARNAAVQTNGTDAVVAPVTGAVTSAVTAATDGDVTTDPATALATPGTAAATSTTTTLVPGLPCLTETLDDLTKRTGLGLGGSKATVLPPGVLPCP